MGKIVIPFSKPYIGHNEITKVVKCLRSGWLTTGEVSFEFEKNVGAYIGSKYNIAVSSCTAAIHLALRALNVKAGDEVIVSPITFVSVVNIIEYCGAIPVFADIEKDTLNVDAIKLEKFISQKTKAIIVTHYAGQACDLDVINSLAKKHNIPVIEDAAHAFGTQYKGKTIGNSNNLVCFSFYATKNITTGEGGMISTNNPKYVERLKILRLHGMTHDAWNRYSIKGSPLYDVVDVGFKYNMTDIAASIGIEQLKRSETFLLKRNYIVKKYRDGIEKNKINCEFLNQKNYSISSNYLFTIILNDKTCRMDAIAKLKAFGICTSVLFVPIYKFSYYKQKYVFSSAQCPVCESISDKILCLPLFTTMKDFQIKYVLDKLQLVLR